MASIYESHNQQVALTGSQTAPSFQPRQVYDPSRMMLRQSEQDLQAFAQFSDTLTKTLFERAKENNENQKNLGIADIVNGRVGPSQAEIVKYNNNKALLQTANDSTQEVINEVRTTNPDLAETMYQQAPAATGWRAYGQAVGKARVAASGLEAYMSDFMRGTEPLIPGTNGQLFAPAMSSTREQLEASWEVGIKQFAQQSGLGQLNPIIIAAELSPIAMRTRSEMLGMQMQQIIATREANEREDLRGSLVPQSELMIKSPEATAKIVFDLNNRLLALNGQNRNKTNLETNEMMENLIRTVNDTQGPDAAKTLLRNYKSTLLNPLNPNLGTYGQRFNLKELSDLVQTTTDQKAKEFEDNISEEAQGITEVFYNNRNPATYREAINRLKKLPQTPEVRAIIERFVNNGPNYDPLRADKLGEAANNLAELEALKKTGAISADIYERESTRFADEKAASDLLPNDSAIEGKARSLFLELAGGAIGKVPEYFNNNSALAVKDITGYAKATIIGELKSGKLDRNAPNIGSLINKRLQDVLEELAPSYILKPKSGVIKFLPASSNSNLKGAIVGSATGGSAGITGRDLANLVQSRVPRVTSAIADKVIDPDRWQVAYDSLASGGKAPSDVDFAAKTAGVSVPEFLRKQAPRLERVYDSNVIAKGNQIYQANKALSPRLAELIANPRTGRTQREQYQVELQRLKQQQQQQSLLLPSSPTPLSTFKKQVSSVVYERPGGQPGLDIFFEDKKVPAVLDGVVKDIRFERGYGNFVVIESIDPDTGEAVDALYAHLASRPQLRSGQQVRTGEIIGTQGGTGNVRSADGTIASIDFLAPAPAGNNSMTPYRYFDKLRRRIGAQFGR